MISRTLPSLLAVRAVTGVSARTLPDNDRTGCYAGPQTGRHDVEYQRPKIPGGIVFEGNGST